MNTFPDSCSAHILHRDLKEYELITSRDEKQVDQSSAATRAGNKAASAEKSEITRLGRLSSIGWPMLYP